MGNANASPGGRPTLEQDNRGEHSLGDALVVPRDQIIDWKQNVESPLNRGPSVAIDISEPPKRHILVPSPQGRDRRLL